MAENINIFSSDKKIMFMWNLQNILMLCLETDPKAWIFGLFPYFKCCATCLTGILYIDWQVVYVYWLTSYLRKE